MLTIHEGIQSGRGPNCVKLAEELEVSTRTLKRDVEFMRDRLNLPIVYDEQRHGLYYSRPVDRFPGLPLHEAERFAVAVAQKAMAQFQGTPFARSLRTAFRRLTQTGVRNDFWGRLQQGFSFRPFAPEATDSGIFDTVIRALGQCRALSFEYKNLGATEAQTRRVHPYHVACIENHWYLFAHDVERQALRTFALARLQAPRLTRQHFVPPRDFDPEDYLRGSFAVLKGGSDYEVVVEFDRWATGLVGGRQWHVSQTLTELPAGGSRLRLRLSGLEEVERWVLSWGTHATVVRPQALRARLAGTGRVLGARYSDAGESQPENRSIPGQTAKADSDGAKAIRADRGL
jgi:proteasome accessory factor B